MSIKHFKILLVSILWHKKQGNNKCLRDYNLIITHILTGHTNTVINHTNEQMYTKNFVF